MGAGEGRQQAGRRQEVREDRQPTDNEGLMERFKITGRERRKVAPPSSGKEPAASRICVTHKHVNKADLPKDKRLQTQGTFLQPFFLN